MGGIDPEGPDASSIKPVSSLRSRFEKIITKDEVVKTKTTRGGSPFMESSLEPMSASTPTKKRPPTPPLARRSFDTGRPIVKPQLQRPLDIRSAPQSQTGSSMLGRPKSMIEHSPPLINVTSPQSPPRVLDGPSLDTTQTVRLSASPGETRKQPPTVPAPRQIRVPSRTSTPVIDPMRSITIAHAVEDGRQRLGRSSADDVPSSNAPKPPPPVNRAGKPGIMSQLAADSAVRDQDLSRYSDVTRRVSPFSTPPDSDEDIPGASTPPDIPNGSKPKGIILSLPRDIPPRQSHVGSARELTERPPRISSAMRSRPSHSRQRSKTITDDVSDAREGRPALPPRREGRQRTESSEEGSSPFGSLRKSLDTSRPSALSQGFTSGIPARKTSHPVAALGKDVRPHLAKAHSARDQSIRYVPSAVRPMPEADIQATTHSDEPIKTTATSKAASIDGSEFPDSSSMNRRPPRFREGQETIHTGFDSRTFAVAGEYVCVTGSQTRVWSLVSGKLVLSMAHGEHVKVTAVASKPARKIEEDGSKLWLGTNWGELQELDIAAKRVTATNEHLHSRREVLEIHRRATAIWTIDNEGKLIVWPPDINGSPDLDEGVLNGRVPRAWTTSIVVGNQLWLAIGKAIWIYRPSATPDRNAFQATQQSTSVPNAGEMVSSAVVPSQQDRVYFGHTDGKVSLFSSATGQHMETFSVNLYKINCLAGVQDRLWVGYNTGMIQTYDTKSRPWTITKSWLSHSQPVLGLKLDETSLWRLDRLHVISLGVDNDIGIWDGITEDDWLEEALRKHEAEYCSFRSMSALILTWNAGAAKPADLTHNEKDGNFFRYLLRREHTPDIIVFGLQELVDLDDKKLTAKSFFKGKSKDSYGHEHLSSVYRAWRDYLTGCLDRSTNDTEAYAQLHTSSLVGLFSCVFVKAASRARIRDVQAAEVKTGMGGLHGNKGALLVRFILDDTSLCFVNCHLAAGQTQTVNRNHDVAAILEAEHLPPSRSAELRNGTYVNGGDGTMITDHEICILNGDLNYRIDTMSRETVLQAIKTGNLGKLLDRDQLLLSRPRNPGYRLRDFVEAPLTFLPTYKYDVGSDNYDSSDKRRAPAWCDRILHRGGDRVQQLDYRRHEVRVSDHRPVTASFRFEVKTVDVELRAQWQVRVEEAFGAHKQREAEKAKLDYLVDIFGMDVDEARRLLNG